MRYRLPVHCTVATLFTVVAALGLITGCEDNEGVAMSLTETTARERIITYFTETLQALPPGVGLSLTPDSQDLSTLSPGFTVPCNDKSGDTSGPVQLQIGYWVVGVPAGQTARYPDLIHNVWTRMGYRHDPNSNTVSTAVTTPDGYTMDVQDAGKGDGSLSMSAGSPCFPENAKGTTTPQPTEIKRPS